MNENTSEKNLAFCIKVNNQAEKLAVLYWLKDLANCENKHNFIKQVANGNHENVNYIFLQYGDLDMSSGPYESRKIFQFSELAAAEKFYNNEFMPISIGFIGAYEGTLFENHLKVGCQDIPYPRLKEIYESAVKAERI